eukprot:2699221-Karenia_brevis.AAC.1
MALGTALSKRWLLSDQGRRSNMGHTTQGYLSRGGVVSCTGTLCVCACAGSSGKRPQTLHVLRA